MKTQNTLENKTMFFAQYWGQNVLSDISNLGNKEIYPVNISNMYGIDRSYLDLKPLSQITNEDAIKLGFTSKRDFLAVADIYYSYHVDYLRSKGYALPYMDLSVEDLIDYGWVKLKEN